MRASSATALAPADRTKLAAVLSLLGSPHSGEVAAAAAAADRLVRGRGLEWSAVLAEPPSTEPWQDELTFCLRHVGWLTAWQAAFIHGMTCRVDASTKQAAILSKTTAMLRARGFQ